MPLRGDAARVGPVLDGALAPAEQRGQRTLAAETTDDANGRVVLRGTHSPSSVTKISLAYKDVVGAGLRNWSFHEWQAPVTRVWGVAHAMNAGRLVVPKDLGRIDPCSTSGRAVERQRDGEPERSHRANGCDRIVRAHVEKQVLHGSANP